MLLSRRIVSRLWPLILVGFMAGACRAGVYRLDTSHTTASFRCGPFGIGPQAGHVTGAQGELIFDAGHPGDSVVEVSLDMATLHTDWRAFDARVRGPDFLDVGHFPLATFKSRYVEVTGEGKADVTGDLTLHGVTRQVTMKVVVRPADLAGRIGFLANARIRRSDFGIGSSPLPGNTIDLRIEAQTVERNDSR